jgi:hypothetical protein
MREEWEMHRYQDAAVEFAHRHPASNLWMDMGLGKTVTMWTLLRDLRRDKAMKRALVICPLRVATQTWPNELREWEHIADMPFSLIRHPDQAVRVQLAMSNKPVHIVNREMLPWLVDLWAEQRLWPYDTLIVDESSSFKDHNTRRFKALKAVRPHTKRIHLLSATPASESYMGLFAQTYLLDRGERFGVSIEHFRKTYFDHDPYKMTYTLKPGSKERIVEKLADITLVMQADDYLPPNKPLMLRKNIVLDESEMKAYRDFERTLILKLPEGEHIEALTGAALSQKLLQAASGAVYDEDRKARHFHNHKIAELEEIVEELDGRPVMVAYWFRSSLERLLRAFPQAKQMDKAGNLLTEWNAGRVPVLLVHPQSVGHGLNMQYGPGRDLVYFDMPWSGELYWQLIRRLARQGQKHVVRVHHLIAEQTIDETVFGSQQNKTDTQQALMDAIKEARKRIKGV